jgi:DNA-binding transcriptional LysR family regulator
LNNWDDLKFCLALARHGTMSAAATSLSTNVATVSRRIARLTEDIGETLFIKEESGWRPTPVAEEIIALAATVENQLGDLRQSGELPRGTTVRISSELQLIQTHFIDAMAEFLVAHPDVNLDVTLQRRSLALGEVELLVTRHEPTDGNLVRKRIGRMACDAYAVAAFADRIENWISLGYPGDEERAYFAPQFGAAPRLTIEGLNICARLMQLMPMAAILPRRFAAQHDDLARISGSEPVLMFDIWVSFHATRRLDPRVGLAKRFAESALAETV